MSKKKKIVIVALGVTFIILGALAPMAIKHIKSERLLLSNERAYSEFINTNECFFKDTYINNVNVEGLTPTEAAALIINDFKSRSILIKTPFSVKEEVLSFDKFDVDFMGLEKYVNETFQNRKITFDEFVDGKEPDSYYYDIVSDIRLKENDLSSLGLFSSVEKIESSDAFLDVDKKDGTVEIVPEVYGNELKDGVFLRKLDEALENSSDEIVFEKSDYTQPQVLSDDAEILDKKDRLSLMLNKEMDITICGSTVDIKSSTARKFIDPEAEDFIDEEEINKYAKSLAKTYNTYGIDRDFLTSTGEMVVVSGGDYGWRLDTQAITESIKEALLDESETVSIEGSYKNRGLRLPADELTGTYVEVSLRDQKVWMYVDGVKIVEDDCTTGMMEDPECHTNCGVFSLTYKTTDRVLKGPTWEDFVYYWMPFDRSIGLHDATWRTEEEFGGSNRYGNGSHGCVNLRLETAGIIYENIQADTPIIVWE